MEDEEEAESDVAGLACAAVLGGFQSRNAVQILQGLPSGPRIMPGGRGWFCAWLFDCCDSGAGAMMGGGRRRVWRVENVVEIQGC